MKVYYSNTLCVLKILVSFSISSIFLGMAVGKDNLARTVSEETGLNLIGTRILVTAFIDAIKEELAEKRRIGLRGFGCFYVKNCEERTARNPRTGEKVVIPKRNISVFTASDILLEKLNGKN